MPSAAGSSSARRGTSVSADRLTPEAGLTTSTLAFAIARVFGLTVERSSSPDDEASRENQCLLVSKSVTKDQGLKLCGGALESCGFLVSPATIQAFVSDLVLHGPTD